MAAVVEVVMAGTWAYEGSLVVAMDRLAVRYPGEQIEILETFDIAYVGWECDYQGALIKHDGVPELVIVDATSVSTGTVPEQLENQLREYRRLIEDTEAVLDRYRSMGGLEGPALVEAHEKHHQRLIARERREGESDQEFEFRQRLFAAGRLSTRVEDLPDSVVARLQDLADQHPDAENLVAVGSGDVTRDLDIPNPEAMRFKWGLARYLATAMRDQNLDAAAVAALAGEIEPAQIDRITKGHVRDVDAFEILRLLKGLGYRIRVEVLPPRDGVEGDVRIDSLRLTTP